jgi:hypothetical protein
VSALFEPACQLSGGGGFAGALEAGHQHDGGWLRGELELGGVAAEGLDQLVADDLDDHLGGRERGEHLGADGLDADAFDQLLDDLEVDVGFEQGKANFLQGLVHVLFGEGALAAEVFEGALEFVCKVLEHKEKVPGSRLKADFAAVCREASGYHAGAEASARGWDHFPIVL